MMKIFEIRYVRVILGLLMTLLTGTASSATTPWEVDTGDYRYDMRLYLELLIKGEKVDYSRYTLAAFCGEECRGVAKVLELGDGRECLYMRARSNQESGETMSFRYYDVQTEEVVDIEGVSFEFVSDSLLGYPSAPFVVDVRTWYDVAVDAGEGGEVEPVSGRYPRGAQLELKAIPAEGHYFVQWSDGSTENPRLIVVDGDIALTAEFAVSTYNAYFMLDGELFATIPFEYDTPIIAPEVSEKTGYTFGGWDMTYQRMPAHDVTVTGYFTINSYTLSIYLNEELYSEAQVEYDSPLNIVEPALPADYVFNGWLDEIPERMPAHDLEIYGTYTDYSVVHELPAECNGIVNIYDLTGRLLYERVSAPSVKELLVPGLYLIQGHKFLMK